MLDRGGFLDGDTGAGISLLLDEKQEMALLAIHGGNIVFKDGNDKVRKTDYYCGTGIDVVQSLLKYPKVPKLKFDFHGKTSPEMPRDSVYKSQSLRVRYDHDSFELYAVVFVFDIVKLCLILCCF